MVWFPMWHNQYTKVDIRNNRMQTFVSQMIGSINRFPFKVALRIFVSEEREWSISTIRFSTTSDWSALEVTTNYLCAQTVWLKLLKKHQRPCWKEHHLRCLDLIEVQRDLLVWLHNSKWNALSRIGAWREMTVALTHKLFWDTLIKQVDMLKKLVKLLLM